MLSAYRKGKQIQLMVSKMILPEAGPGGERYPRGRKTCGREGTQQRAGENKNGGTKQYRV